jgi:hypothetical protein
MIPKTEKYFNPGIKKTSKILQSHFFFVPLDIINQNRTTVHNSKKMKITAENKTAKERNFPLRLNQQESDALSKLRKALNASTDIAAVRHVITHYLQQDAALTAQQRENEQLKQQVSELKQRITDFTGAFRRLSSKL